MSTTSELYQPRELIAAVYEKDPKPYNPLFIALFFRGRVTSKTRDVQLDQIADPGVPMAVFCSPMVGATVQRDKGYSSKVITPGYLKPRHVIDLNKLAVRAPGTKSYEEVNPRTYLVMTYLKAQRESILRRAEYMAIQSITTGKIIVSGDSIETYEIDWDIDAANLITQAGAAAWSKRDKTTWNPHDDIETYAESSKAPVNIIVMGGEVWKSYRSFKAVKDVLDTRRGSTATLETALSGLGEDVSFKGYVGDVAIVVYSGKYEDGDTEKLLLPADSMVLGNTEHAGILAHGMIQDRDANAAGIFAAEMFPKNYVMPGDPPLEYVQTHSAPLPVPAGVNKFVTVKVA